MSIMIKGRQKKQPITNRDCLRAKTDEELAAWLCLLDPNCDFVTDIPCREFCESGCTHAWLKWLQKEADND